MNFLTIQTFRFSIHILLTRKGVGALYIIWLSSSNTRLTINMATFICSVSNMDKITLIQVQVEHFGHEYICV